MIPMRYLTDADALTWLLGQHDDAEHRPVASRSTWLDQIDQQRGTLLVPATVLAEVLTDTGRAGEGAWRTLHAHRVVEVLPFDERAAREQARLAGEGAALAVALKAARLDRRQLVVLARLRGAALLSTQAGMRTLAQQAGVAVQSVRELVAGCTLRQLALPLEDGAVAGAVAPVAAPLALMRAPGMDLSVFRDIAQALDSIFDDGRPDGETAAEPVPQPPLRPAVPVLPAWLLAPQAAPAAPDQAPAPEPASPLRGAAPR
jgi:hypothetical protein